MSEPSPMKWEERVVAPDQILEKIKPGMSIFAETGLAEPRTLVKRLMASDANKLQDLELIQLASFGDAVSFHQRPDSRLSQNRRCRHLYPRFTLDGFVKSPTSVLRYILRHCDVL